MRPSHSRLATTIVAGLLVAACASTSTSTASPTTSATSSPSGMPTTTPVRTSPPVAIAPTITQIAAGSSHTCALRTDGGVKCWGANYGGELGNGTTSDTVIPGAVDVLGLSQGVSAITAGNGYNCALTNSGEVKCWGYNAYGQLGSDAPTEGVPVDVAGLNGITAVDVNGLSCALTGPGGVKCWGANNVGQLGNGTTTDSTVPVDVSGLGSGIRAISVGGLHACALTAGGGVKCWGFNPYGQLGNDTTTNSAVPVDVLGLASGVRAIAAGQNHTCALLSGGAVKCWGSNYDGVLGNRTTTENIVPRAVDVSGLGGGVSAIAAGGRHTCALMSNGGVECWGYNEQGQLGNGTTTGTATPGAVDVAGLSSGIRAISAGDNHTCALSTGGGVKCWGYNSEGQLNAPAPEISAVPIDVDTETPPSPPPSPPPAALPTRGSARDIGEGVLMAPGPGGRLFVSLPVSGESVLLAMLDPTGRLATGWPIVLSGATACGQLLPVEDGSVRVLCTPAELNRELNQGGRAYAFDSKGAALAGWPIDLAGSTIAGRMVGDDLTILLSVSGGDLIQEGQPDHAVGLVTIGADGAVESGVHEPRFSTWPGEQWAVGPDRVAYGTEGLSGFDEGSPEVSRITALDISGVPAGWPVSFDGLASGPAVGPGGRIVLTVGSLVRSTSRVLAFDAASKRVSSSSGELPTATAEFGDTGGCGLGNPHSPLLAGDGTTFVMSWATDAVYALDVSLNVKRGWPYEPPTSFVRRDSRYIREDAFCPSLSIPAVGPDSTLYLPLQAGDATAGGSIVAVGPDGQVRAGWPVGLRRLGAEFWSVVVGSDGTVYALAIELESSDSSSATILAIGPDSTVHWTTTVVEP